MVDWGVPSESSRGRASEQSFLVRGEGDAATGTLWDGAEAEGDCQHGQDHDEAHEHVRSSVRCKSHFSVMGDGVNSTFHFRPMGLK